VVLAADDVVPCILAARYCRAANIPLIEGWAIPFCNARVFTADTPTLEACYGLTDIPEPVSAMSAEQRKAMTEAMIMTVARIEGVVENYAPDILERLQAGQIPSFAPMVWFAAVRMSIEVIKALLGRGRLALAPEFAVYDPFLHRIAQQV
jgi:molybdopterin/thiamine biosynthesis adenylyltransferase